MAFDAAKILKNAMSGGFISPGTYQNTVNANPALALKTNNSGISLQGPTSFGGLGLTSPTGQPAQPGAANPQGSSPSYAGAIVAPHKTTLGQASNEVKASGFLPSISNIQSKNVSGFDLNGLPKVSGIDPNSVGQLNGFDDNYYNNLSNQASKRLQQQYFTGDNSILAQRENQIKQRGLFGSGIGESATNSVYKTFGDEMANFQSTLATQRAQNDIDTQKYNIGNTLDITKSNKGYEQFNVQSLLDALKGNKEIETGNVNRTLDTAFKNQGDKLQLGQLGLSAAGDVARDSTNFDTKIFDTLVNQNNEADKSKNDQINQLNDILANSGIDPQTKEYFKAELLGNYPNANAAYKKSLATSKNGNLSQQSSQSTNEISKANPYVQIGGTTRWNGQLMRRTGPDSWVPA